jgi:predicted transcriptional regulator
MRKNRCYHDHAQAILSIALEPVEATELFWKAKISGHVYSRAKAELFAAGLLETVDKGKLHTTEKGKKWLHIYKSLKKLGEAETHE